MPALSLATLTEEQQMIVSEVRRFVEKEVIPVATELEHRDEYPAQLVDQMKGLGMFGGTIPETYGGLELPFTTYAAIVEELSRGWMSLGGILNTHTMVSWMIKTYGSEHVKSRLLPQMATGERRCGLCMTEPDAGSDLQAINTKAVRDGDDYLLNGNKMWVSNGVHAKIFAVLVKTDPQAKPPYTGMSVFIVEKEPTPGMTVGRIIEKLGYKGIDTTELAFEDARVPAESLLGGEEGQGWLQIMSTIEIGRVNVASRAVGVASAALEDSIRYAKQRETFGQPIANHQAIQLMLAGVGAKVEGGGRPSGWGGRCRRRAGGLACGRGRGPRRRTPASAPTCGREWRSCSARRWPRRWRSRRCASTAATATARSCAWSAITATPRSC